MTVTASAPAIARVSLCHAWSSNFAAPGTGQGMPGSVSAFENYYDASAGAERLIVGGDFNLVATPGATNVASWDGTAWQPLGTGVNGSVEALLSVDSTSAMGPALYAGGSFTTADGSSAKRIASWSGSAWSNLGTGMDGSVEALAIYNDGGGDALYAGGSFTLAGGASANRVAKWNGSAWSALGTGIDNTVHALTTFDVDGAGPGPVELIAGGEFAVAGGVSVTRVARWNGTAWKALGTFGTATCGLQVRDLLVFDDDGAGPDQPALYAAGHLNFASFCDPTTNYVMKWTGSSWVTVGGAFNEPIFDLLGGDVGDGPELFACGFFSTNAGSSCHCIARFDGLGWRPLAQGLSGGGGLGSDCGFAMGCFDDGANGGADLYAGGQFTVAGAEASNYIGEWVDCISAPFPMVDGELVVTSFGPTGDVPAVTLIDARAPYPAPDTAWAAPKFHNEFAASSSSEVWNMANLGPVFGVTVDRATPRNIYVAAANVYSTGLTGPGGAGAVYKIDGTSGDISTLVVLGNTGPALGDICYEPYRQLLYVSNFEDGTINVVELGGNLVATFDPFGADDGTAGFAPRGERVWAVQAFNKNELYFSVWLRDPSAPTEAWPAAWGAQGSNIANNAIFKVGLDASGIPDGNVTLVEVLPVFIPQSGSPYTYSAPCSDIAFTTDRSRMLVGLRPMTSNTSIGFGFGPTLEYTGGGAGNQSANWVPSATEYFVGHSTNGANGLGGADYSCGFEFVATGSDLEYNLGDVYGVQLIPAGGNTLATATTTSFLLDLDDDLSVPALGGIGDVEYLRGSCWQWWFTYGTAKTSSLGCLPRMQAIGEPSSSASSGFIVQCYDAIGNKSGLMFFGLSGANNVPFQGGHMYVKTPIMRTPLQFSGGTSFACDGHYSIDMNAYAASGAGPPQLLTPGTQVNCQYWSRDPAASFTISLSDGLEYVVQP
jgi:hypothetical protein